MRTRIGLALALIVTALALQAPAGAHARRPAKAWEGMSLRQVIAYQRAVIRRDTSTIRWWRTRSRLLASLHARGVRFKAGIPYDQWWHARQREWTRRELRESLARLAQARWQVPAWFRAQALCIESHENGGYGWAANTGNGYQTGMQFTRSTWQRAGGQVDGNADFYWASPAETIYRAYRIWRQDGGSWREWSTRGYCGLS